MSFNCTYWRCVYFICETSTSVAVQHARIFFSSILPLYHLATRLPLRPFGSEQVDVGRVSYSHKHILWCISSLDSPWLSYFFYLPAPDLPHPAHKLNNAHGVCITKMWFLLFPRLVGNWFKGIKFARPVKLGVFFKIYLWFLVKTVVGASSQRQANSYFFFWPELFSFSQDFQPARTESR